VIKGIGVDIVSVRRIKRAVERWGERFLSRIFTAEEIEHSYRRSEPYASLAVRFAAKEALMKAVGPHGISFRDVAVLNREDGSPFISDEGGLRATLSSRGIGRLHLSLSHERDYGVAFVVAEKGGEG
jgi:holo-[acyl-carrier-protein] synthase